MKVSIRPTAHDQLRLSTHHLHELLDSEFDLNNFSSAAGYSAFLLANWPCASIEAALDMAGIRHVLPDWDKRRRRRLLADDLAQFGISPPSTTPLAIDPDRGTLLGWSYVLEGSRLGAAMILRAVHGSGKEVAWETHFLRHGEGEHLWQSYKTALSAIDGDQPAISNACAGAELAFQCFLAAINQ